jgi:hypothetical protein
MMTKLGIYVDGTYQSGKKNYEFDWRRPINIETVRGQRHRQAPSTNYARRAVMGGATRSNAK